MLGVGSGFSHSEWSVASLRPTEIHFADTHRRPASIFMGFLVPHETSNEIEACLPSSL